MSHFLQLLTFSALLAAPICVGMAAIADFWVRRHSSRKEKLLLESLGSVQKLIAQARKEGLDEEQKEKLWSDIMTYVMNARSQRQAHQNVQAAATILGEKGQILRETSEEVLNQRFSSDPQTRERALTTCER